MVSVPMSRSLRERERDRVLDASRPIPPVAENASRGVKLPCAMQRGNSICPDIVDFSLGLFIYN
jgi:hypothetical protein